MKRTTVKKIIDVPASNAWEVISELTGIEDYLPGVSSSEVFDYGKFPVRSILLLDGSHYDETITRIDHENMELHYSINDPSPFSYSQLAGVIKISPVTENSCEVYWSCIYNPENGPAEEIDTFLSLLIGYAIKGVEKLCKKLTAFA